MSRCSLPLVVMLSKCMDIRHAQRTQLKHSSLGTPHPKNLPTAFSFTACCNAAHSAAAGLKFCLCATLPHGAVQRYPDEGAMIVGESARLSNYE